jgi:MFS family permease
VLALRFFDRVGKGVRSSPRDALIAESTAAAARGRAFGFHRAADHAGAVAGPLLAFVILSVFAPDLRSLFLLSLIPGAAAVIVLALATTEPPIAPRPDPRPLPLRATWREMPRPLRRFSLILLLFTLGNSTDAFLLLKAQELGVAVALLPILWIVLHVVKTASSMPAGVASDRLGRKRLILAGWGVYVVTYGGFMLADAAWHVWGLFALYGLFFGLTEGVEKALIADLAPADLRGSAFGLYHLTVGLGALPASLLFGAVWELFGSAAAFGLGAALALAATLLLAGLRLRPMAQRLGVPAPP